MSIYLPAGLVLGMPCNSWSPARTDTYFELRQMYKYATAQTWKKTKAFQHPSVQVNLHANQSYPFDFCFVT